MRRCLYKVWYYRLKKTGISITIKISAFFCWYPSCFSSKCHVRKPSWLLMLARCRQSPSYQTLFCQTQIQPFMAGHNLSTIYIFDRERTQKIWRDPEVLRYDKLQFFISVPSVFFLGCKHYFSFTKLQFPYSCIVVQYIHKTLASYEHSTRGLKLKGT